MGKAANGLSVCQLPSDVATGLPGSGLVKVGQPEVAHCGDLVNCRRHEAVVSEKVLLLRGHASKGGAGQVGVSTGSCRPWFCAPGVCCRPATLHSAACLPFSALPGVSASSHSHNHSGICCL